MPKIREDVLEELYPHLSNYVRKYHGRDIGSRKAFRCLFPGNHKNGDSHPSSTYRETDKNGRLHPHIICGCDPSRSGKGSYDLLDLVALDTGKDLERDFGEVVQIAAERCGVQVVYEDGKTATNTGYIDVPPRAPSKRYDVIVDPTPYATKPENKDRGIIRNKTKDPANAKRLTLEEIKGVVLSGGTVQPCYGKYYIDEEESKKENKRVDKFFGTSQQIFFVDIDNEKGGVPVDEPLTMVQAIEMCADRGIMPFMVYPTFTSGAKGYEKFRICFVLDKLLNVSEIGSANIQKVRDFLADPFKAYADEGTRDLNRLFYGTDKEAFFYEESCVVPWASVVRGVSQTEIVAETVEEEEPLVESGEVALDSFFENIKGERYKPIATGITDLDNRLLGGIMNEWLVLIGAEPGSGKTALTAQILENWAEKGRRCSFYNLEMSVDQMIARSLSRTMYRDTGYQMTAIEILKEYEWTADQRKAVMAAHTSYRQKIAPNMLFNPDNTGTDVDKILASMERRAKAAEERGEVAPIVALDYLQYVTSENSKEDDVAVLKRALQGMKDYAVNHHTIAFCVMATSRAANKSNDATMSAGRDTSNLEYTADLMLQLKKDKEDAATMKLFVTKSRFCSANITEGTPLTFLGGQSYFQSPLEAGMPFNYETSRPKKAGVKA